MSSDAREHHPGADEDAQMAAHDRARQPHGFGEHANRHDVRLSNTTEQANAVEVAERPNGTEQLLVVHRKIAARGPMRRWLERCALGRFLLPPRTCPDIP
jgi:hypothetical protein